MKNLLNRKSEGTRLWVCTGLDPMTGQKRSLRVEAVDKESAANQIRGTAGLISLTVKKVGVGNVFTKLAGLKFGKKGSTKEIQELVRSLATTSETLNPMDSFILARDNMSSRNDLKEVLDNVIGDMEAGVPLDTAIEKQSKHLGDAVVSVYLSGSSTGRLPALLNTLADDMDKAKRVRATFRSALLEPALLFVFVVVTVYIQGTLVFPRMVEFLSEEVQSEEKPSATMRYTIWFAETLNTRWMWIIVGMIGIWFGMKRVLAIQQIGLWVGEMKCKLPVFGNISHLIDISSFCSTMGITLSAGLPINECLGLASKSVKNLWIRQNVVEISGRIASGDDPQSAFMGYDKALTRAPSMLMRQTTTGIRDPGKPWATYASGLGEAVEKKAEGFSAFLNPILVVLVSLVIVFTGMASIQGMDNVLTGISDTDY